MPPKPSKVLKPAWASSKNHNNKKTVSLSDNDAYKPPTIEKHLQKQLVAGPLSQVAQNTRSGMDMDIDSSGPRMRLSLDIGTTKTKAAYSIHNPEDLDTQPAILHVMWANGTYETPTVFTYRNGKFYWGQQVESWLDSHEITESAVMRQAKLALHKDDKVRHVREAVEALLSKEGRSIYDIFGDYVSALVVEAKKRIFSSTAAIAAPDKDIPIDLMVSVPQVWQPQSNIVLVEAAKRVGVDNCSVVGEALCVAATVLARDVDDDKVPEAQRLLKRGDMVFVLDLGGGTGDFVLIELTDPVESSPRLGMKVALPATGSLCGGVWVNRNFTKWLEHEYFPSQPVGLAKRANLLGFNNPQEFLSRASASLDEQKLKFPSAERYVISVSGKADFEDVWSHRLYKKDMEKFFDPVVHDIDVQVDAMLASTDLQKIKCFILSGGLGKSKYVIDHMTEKWSLRGVKVLFPKIEHLGPVPEGALRRYTSSILEPVGRDWSLCVVRGETFDPLLHKDAILDESLVKTDPIDSSLDSVEDRCLYIKNAVTDTTQECWSQRYPVVVNKKKPIELVAEVFWTTRQDIADHEPLYEPHSTELRPGFMKFAEIRKTIADHAKMGWDIIEADNGETVYEIWVCVVIRYDSDNIRCGLKVITDGTQPFDEQGNMIDVGDHAKIFWDEEDWEEVWNQRFNHVARETDPLAVMLPNKSTAPAKTAAVAKKTKKKDLPMFIRDTTEMDTDEDIPF